MVKAARGSDTTQAPQQSAGHPRSFFSRHSVALAAAAAILGIALPLISKWPAAQQSSPLPPPVAPLPPPPPVLPPPEQDLDIQPRTVWWHAPFFSGGGMGTEALLLVLGLQRHTTFAGRVWISSHGDVDHYEIFAGLDREAQGELLGMLRSAHAATLADAQSAIIICHSEPGAWALPIPLYQTAMCPPIPLEEAAYVIARAMFETDRISKDHAHRCNQMAEVWVPTEFHRRTFQASGVDPSKIQVVPEPVDVAAFDPDLQTALELPLGTRVFGPAWPHESPAPPPLEPAMGKAAAGAGAGASDQAGSSRTGRDEPFVFLSVFKWETRKGWDVLLRAFLSAFTAEDNVLLLLHTKPFHSEPNFPEQMEGWVRRELPDAAGQLDRLPSVYVLGDHIPQQLYPRIFKAANTFVLPTRGEGWGLPVVEAMSMALPVIVTNFSGPTAYLDDTVGYPLNWELAEVPPGSGAFSGHRWAQPSAGHLAELMRHVVAHREEAAARGRAARQRMVERYSPAAVADIVAGQLRRIERQLAERQQAATGRQR